MLRATNQYMFTINSSKKIFRIIVPLIIAFHFGSAQKNIILPYQLREETKPQLSGMVWHNNKLYMVPQFLSNRNHRLEGDLFIYSVSADSIQRVIDGTDTALSGCNAIRVRNAERLPKEIHDNYGGFEAIAIDGNTVYLTIESKQLWNENYIVCGTLSPKRSELILHPKRFIRLKRFDETDNAGFESLAYHAKEKKLTAIYEFNAASGANFAYEIDRKLKKVQKITIPFAYFRITEITNSNDTLFALNYHWGGDYSSYLRDYRPEHVPDSVPELKSVLEHDTSYLSTRSKSFTKIIYLDPVNRSQWKTAMVVENLTSENNWEAMVRFKDGFLLLSDSNERGPLVTTLRYVPYRTVPK